MVSFVCDFCQETLKKAKLDQHRQRCRSAQFSCIDCSTTFVGDQYRSHTQCISEAEKYQKSVFKGNKKGQANGAANGNKKNAPAATNGFTQHPVTKVVQNTSTTPKSIPLIQEIKMKEQEKAITAEDVVKNAENDISLAILRSTRIVMKKKQDTPLSFRKLRLKVAKKVLKEFPDKSLDELKASVEDHLVFKYDDGKISMEI
ncbi:hypothetical protein BC829DRAFT_374052 [Chytridium lagenaria]|nr:hypothetical protein BC829DRAFT_374052 [Chytridium lagenaria]